MAAWQLVLLILAIVALVVVSYVLYDMSKSESGNVEDNLCRQSNRWRQSSTIPGLDEVRPKLVFGKPRVGCATQYETIDASDANKCDVDPARLKTIDGLRECAAHQIAELAWRCWWMSGEGSWDRIGSWKCFTGKIVMNQYAGEESAIKVREELTRQVKDKLKCGYGIEQVELTGISCTALAAQLAEKLHSKLTDEAVIEYYKDKILYGEVKDSGNSQVVENSLELCAIELANPSDLITELITMKDVNGRFVREKTAAEVLDRKILQKTGCLDIVSYAEENARIVEEYQNKILDINKKISSLLQSHLVNPDEDVEIKTEAPEDEESDHVAEFRPRLEDLFESTLVIGGQLPNIGAITESDIRKALADKESVTQEGVKYSRSFNSKDDFRLLEELKINPNTLFEVALCDPQSELGDGILANECRFDFGQGVLLGKAGTVGTSREGSPYCNVLNAFNEIKEIDSMQKYCQSMTNK